MAVHPDPRESTRNSDRNAKALGVLKRDERRALWLLGLGPSYTEVCELTGWTYTKGRWSRKNVAS